MRVRKLTRVFGGMCNQLLDRIRGYGEVGGDCVRLRRDLNYGHEVAQGVIGKISGSEVEQRDRISAERNGITVLLRVRRFGRADCAASAAPIFDDHALTEESRLGSDSARAATSVTAGQLIQKVRMEAAVTLLLQSRDSIALTAYKCGYSAGMKHPRSGFAGVDEQRA
jgi:hypothetical protein